MSHNLFRLSEKIYNTPHLISQSTFESISDYIEKRNFEDFDLTKKDLALNYKRVKRLDRLQYNEDTQVGVIPVEGVLSYVAFEAMCEGENVSYQAILSDAETMLKAGAKIIVIDADSGGGEAYGMMENSTRIRELADKYGAKLITYVDGMAASAMYGIAAVSHKVIANPEAEVGSIGVVVSLANYNEADKKRGVKKTYITAGESKVPFDDDGEFTEKFKQDIQGKVDTLYEKFTNHVAINRGLSQEKVKSFGANTFLAEDAKNKGLVDAIMTREEFFTYLGNVVETGDHENMSLNLNKEKGTEMSDKNNQADLSAELSKQVAEMKASLEASFAEQLATQAAASADQIAQLTATLKTKELAEAAAKTASRLAQLTAAVGTEKAPALSAAFAVLDDQSFELAVSELKTSRLSTDEDEGGDQGEGLEGDAELSVDEITARQLKEQYKNIR